jgi:ABC-type transport system involved in cytochrome bd biosynthesis fused ATPase/permease subunit
MGILRDSAKVLISHQPQYLKDARIVFVIKDGQIVDSGSPSDLGILFLQIFSPSIRTIWGKYGQNLRF